jgi:hypothetical protein
MRERSECSKNLCNATIRPTVEACPLKNRIQRNDGTLRQGRKGALGFLSRAKYPKFHRSKSVGKGLDYRIGDLIHVDYLEVRDNVNFRAEEVNCEATGIRNKCNRDRIISTVNCINSVSDIGGHFWPARSLPAMKELSSRWRSRGSEGSRRAGSGACTCGNTDPRKIRACSNHVRPRFRTYAITGIALAN